MPSAEPWLCACLRVPATGVAQQLRGAQMPQGPCLPHCCWCPFSCPFPTPACWVVTTGHCLPLHTQDREGHVRSGPAPVPVGHAARTHGTSPRGQDPPLASPTPVHSGVGSCHGALDAHSSSEQRARAHASPAPTREAQTYTSSPLGRHVGFAVLRAPSSHQALAARTFSRSAPCPRRSWSWFCGVLPPPPG